MKHSLESLTVEDLKRELTRRKLLSFTKHTFPDYEINWHHELLCEYLQDWVNGKIKKLMVFLPPQHGKSELTSRRLPAFLLGKNPKAKVVGASYSQSLATDFNKDVQRIIDSKEYAEIFPGTRISSGGIKGATDARRNADVFETIEHLGYYKSVGVGGPLTGTPADFGIIDDPVKDAIEAESLTYRERIWEWYTKVFLTRLHNDSQQLITMTRWHPDDLAGRILNNQIGWEVIRLEAIKDKYNHPKDPRETGEPLWSNKHSLERLQEIKKLSKQTFNSLYQQDPKPDENKLIYTNWEEGDFPEEAPAVYGMDFGFNDPDTLIKVAIDEGKKTIYVDEIFFVNKQSTQDLINKVKLHLTGEDPVICDSAETRLINDLRAEDISAIKAKKGPDSVLAGIKKLQGYKIIVTRRSENVKNELRNYSFLSGTNKVPKDENNHTLDPLRYVIQYWTESPNF